MEEVTKPSKRPKIEESLAFTKEDAQGIQFPYNDAMMVTLNIINYDVRCFLIGNKCSINILFYDAFS